MCVSRVGVCVGKCGWVLIGVCVLVYVDVLVDVGVLGVYVSRCVC